MHGDRALIIRPWFVREFHGHPSSASGTRTHRSTFPDIWESRRQDSRAIGCMTVSGTPRGLAAGMLSGWAVWCQAFRVISEELLDLLSRLRCAPIGRARLRAPHKPLLLLWLFGRFSAVGSTVATYAEAEEPVSALINEFGPPVASAAAARRRAAMPFVHQIGR